jgi:tetratricopeptide (TPR) repeat protein
MGQARTVGMLCALVLSLVTRTASADRAVARALDAAGQRLSELGDEEAALTRFHQSIRSDPDYLPAYEHAIPLWFQLGRSADARPRLEHLTLRCQGCAFAWYALGGLYRRTGEHNLAIQAYREYLNLRPADPDALFGLGMALWALSDERAPSVLRHYLRQEKRPERSAYRAQVERMLAQLDVAPSTRPPRPDDGTGALRSVALQLVRASSWLQGLAAPTK